MLAVRRIVDEAAEMDAMRARQIAENVPGTDLVALVGRIGDAVRQEQQIAHRAQPSPRTIGGPSRLATASGRRFHAAMNSRYFGLSGLWSGIVATGREMVAIVQPFRLESPVVLEGERTGALLAAAEVEQPAAAGSGAPHHLPVHEVVARPLPRPRGAAAVIRQHLVAKVEVQH